jgi:hypothetical protein
MEVTEAEFASEYLACTTHLSAQAKDFVEALPGFAALQARQHMEGLCSRLPYHTKADLVHHVFVCVATTCSSKGDSDQAIAQANWLVHRISGRAARVMIQSLIYATSCMKVESGYARVVDAMAPELVLRCLVGWKSDENNAGEPDLRLTVENATVGVEKTMLWTEAVARGYGLYSKHLASTMLLATSLPEVLIQLVAEYICET